MDDFDDHLYVKCQHCELFVFDNPSYGDSPGLARYEHAHRDTVYDREVDGSHDPVPGEARPLSWWKKNGPPLMRARFTE